MPKQPTPETEASPDSKFEKRTRRKFTANNKLRIIQEADACKHGELGALLRREKIYSNQLSNWRREYVDGSLEVLSKSIPGPVTAKSAEQREIEKLKRQITKLNGELDTAIDCLDIQKSLVNSRSFEQWEYAVSVAIEQRPARLALNTACRMLCLNRSSV